VISLTDLDAGSLHRTVAWTTRKTNDGESNGVEEQGYRFSLRIAVMTRTL
jgi:guanylate kinase